MSTPPGPLYAVSTHRIPGSRVESEPLRTTRDPVIAAWWFFRWDRPRLSAALHTGHDDQVTASTADELLTSAYRELACLDDAPAPADPLGNGLLNLLETAQVAWLTRHVTTRDPGAVVIDPDQIDIRDWRRAGRQWASVVGAPPRRSVTEALAAALPMHGTIATTAMDQAGEELLALTEVVDELAAHSAHDPQILREVASALLAANPHHGAGSATAAFEWCLDRIIDTDPRITPLLTEFTDRPAVAQWIREQVRARMGWDYLLNPPPGQAHRIPQPLEEVRTRARRVHDAELTAPGLALSDAQAAARWRARIPTARFDADTHHQALTATLNRQVLGPDADLFAPLTGSVRPASFAAAEAIASRLDRRHALLGHLDHLADLRASAPFLPVLGPYIRQAQTSAAEAVPRLSGRGFALGGLGDELLDSRRLEPQDIQAAAARILAPQRELPEFTNSEQRAQARAGTQQAAGDYIELSREAERTRRALAVVTPELTASATAPDLTPGQEQTARTRDAHRERYPLARQQPSEPDPGSIPGPRTAQWQDTRRLLADIPAALPPRQYPDPDPAPPAPATQRTQASRIQQHRTAPGRPDTPPGLRP